MKCSLSLSLSGFSKMFSLYRKELDFFLSFWCLGCPKPVPMAALVMPNTIFVVAALVAKVLSS